MKGVPDIVTGWRKVCKLIASVKFALILKRWKSVSRVTAAVVMYFFQYFDSRK
jgi:hypothetical protein